MSHDAVVIGAGHNGLVAANLLADRGWSVLVCEAAPEPGGAVRSGEYVRPGFVCDRFSAFYPFGYASPAIRGLDLEAHGLQWVRAPAAVAHPGEDGSCALLSTDLDETMASLDAFAPGDGEAWRALYDRFRNLGGHLVRAMVTPIPPVRPTLGLLAALGSAREVAEFARFALLPVRRLAEETFEGPGGGWLLAGNALHADLTPEMNGSGLFGWLLCGLGQQVGFPVPRGGAGELTRALVRRLEGRGGQVVCGRRVQRILVERGRATGVRFDDGEETGARRAVLADTSATALYRDLLPGDSVPGHVHRALERVQFDNATVKVDWALDGPIPWAAADAAKAGTVHLADGIDGLTVTSSELAMRRVPEHPFLLLGQYSMTDPTRCPPGKEVAWAYTHVPHETMRTRGELEAFTERMEQEVERRAPGFTSRILGRHVMGPLDLEAADENLVDGAVNNGTAQLQQQLVFRPIPGLGRPGTPVRGVFLASAAAHPGGGVHGGPGANAARAALAHARLGLLRR